MFSSLGLYSMSGSSSSDSLSSQWSEDSEFGNFIDTEVEEMTRGLCRSVIGQLDSHSESGRSSSGVASVLNQGNVTRVTPLKPLLTAQKITDEQLEAMGDFSLLPSVLSSAVVMPLLTPSLLGGGLSRSPVGENNQSNNRASSLVVGSARRRVVVPKKSSNDFGLKIDLSAIVGKVTPDGVPDLGSPQHGVNASYQCNSGHKRKKLMQKKASFVEDCSTIIINENKRPATESARNMSQAFHCPALERFVRGKEK